MPGSRRAKKSKQETKNLANMLMAEILHQLRLVGYLIIYKVSKTSQVVVCDEA